MPETLTVVADDLTGACEIAGVGHRLGRPAVVTLRDQSTDPGAPLQVFDSETRLSPAAEAAETLDAIGRAIAATPGATVFKKTDSVLRGPVRPELEALAGALGCRRILLVPGNPALRRVVKDGRYFVGETPLHQTGFATDPHHPARSSDVRELLGDSGRLPVVSVRLGDRLPDEGLLVGDVSSEDDLAAWARSLPADTLVAGSSAFFGAWFGRHAATTAAPAAPPPGGPVLLISGTTFGPQRQRLCRDVSAERITLDRLEDLDDWSARLLRRLASSPSAIACVDGPVLSESPASARIASALAEVAHRVFQSGAARHLVIEGGATAAAVVRRLGWLELESDHEWAPGIVSLRPAAAPDARLTVKPGSYPWPESILPLLFSPATVSP